MNRVGLAALLFLVSGFSALIYQVIWQRILGIFSGVHIYSITMIVTAFMAGLGVGSLIGGRVADRLTRKRAVMGFALCELCIGLFALISIWLYYDIAYVQLGFLVRYKLALPVVHFLLLLIPTFLMGASLPLLSRGLVQDAKGAARTIGLLYGVNTLGAALGAFAAIWWLIGALGFIGTVRVAAVLNFAAALGALVLVRQLQDAPAQQPATERSEEPLPASDAVPDDASKADVQFGVRGWASLYWLSGFIALSFEILWFRILDVSIKQSPYTFGHLLGVFLVFLGLGGITGALIVDRARRPGRVFLWGQWLISVSAAVVLVTLCRLPPAGWPLAGLHEFWNSDMGIVMDELRRAWGGQGDSTLVFRAFQLYGLLPVALIGPPTFLMGLTFAFVQRAVQTDPSQVGWRVGLIQTANIVGSIFGSLVTGTFFLSKLGTPTTLQLLFVMGAIFGCLGAVHASDKLRWPAVAGVLTLSLLLAAGIPQSNGFWARFHGANPEDIIVSEDASSTVSLQRVVSQYGVMRVNGAGHSVVPFGGPHTILGLLPALIHPDPRSVLLIGLGAGNTPWAAAAQPSLETIDVYEIAKPELDVMLIHNQQWYPVPELPQLLGDPRVNLRFSDGRLALRIEERKYDLIEIDALEPYMAYSGNLYSKEFFELARDSLAPGGLFLSYTPTSRTRRTLISAFPYVLWLNKPGYLQCMLGSNEPIVYDPDTVLERLFQPGVQAWFGKSAVTSSVDIQRYVTEADVVMIGPHNRDQYLDGDVSTDLYPRDEFDKTVPLEGD